MREFHYDSVSNFLWVDSIVGASIPNNFLPAVEKGFKERLERGVIAGCRIQNVCAEVFFGKHHPVDSSEAAFKTAGSMAFRNVFQQAKPGLLETDRHAPRHGAGSETWRHQQRSLRPARPGAGHGFGRRRSANRHRRGPLGRGEPASACAIASMTGGQGSFTMEFARYDLVPPNVQKEIVEKNQHKEEEDE